MALIDYSQPSDYRLKAIKAKQAGHSASNVSGDDSHLASSISLSKTSLLTETVTFKDIARAAINIGDSISERWKQLLTEKQIQAAEARKHFRNIVVQREPIRTTIDINMSQLSNSIDWTIENAVTPFKLPTAYILPGQDNILLDDDKEKVHIDHKTANIEDYTVVQLEDVVKRWLRHVKRIIKTNHITVLYCRLCSYSFLLLHHKKNRIFIGIRR